MIVLFRLFLTVLGCIPLLVQLVQSDRDGDTRKKAAQALHNLVNSQSDEKLRKRESRVLKLLEQCRNYTEALRKNLEYEQLECSTSTSEGIFFFFYKQCLDVFLLFYFQMATNILYKQWLI